LFKETLVEACATRLVDEPMEVCVALEAEEAIRGCGEATSF